MQPRTKFQAVFMFFMVSMPVHKNNGGLPRLYHIRTSQISLYQNRNSLAIRAQQIRDSASNFCFGTKRHPPLSRPTPSPPQKTKTLFHRCNLSLTPILPTLLFNASSKHSPRLVQNWDIYWSPILEFQDIFKTFLGIRRYSDRGKEKVK